MSHPTATATTTTTLRQHEYFTCCPYGPLYAVPVSCTVIGFVFFHIAAFGCVTYKTVSPRDYGSTSLTATTIGYWSRYDTTFGGCIRYTNDMLASVWRFGRFIGLFGSFITWAILAAVLLASCFKYPHPKIYFISISAGMGIISLFSLLLLVGLSTDENLSIAGGGVLAILASFLWAAGAVSMFYCMNERKTTPSPTTPVSRNAGPTYPLPTEGDDPGIDATDNIGDPGDIVIDEESSNFDTGQFGRTTDPVGRRDVADNDALSDYGETQVERIKDLNGNETIITTKTTYLPNGTKRVIKTIESVEDVDF